MKKMTDEEIEDFEKELKKDIEEDNIIVIKKTKENEHHFPKAIVNPKLKKTHPLSIRIAASDLDMIRYNAAKAGIPYQTLIKSILHQYAVGHIKVTL